MIQYFNKVYGNSKEDFFEYLHNNLNDNKKMFIVTANPETFMNGKKNKEYDKILLSENVVITPDGIGVVKSLRGSGYKVKERITGVDITTELLRYADQNCLSVYFYGSKQEVLDKLLSVMNTKYPDAKVVGLKDGYSNNDKDVFEDILLKKPDIVLVALGVPKQEIVIDRYIDRFDKGIFMGIGGSLDVISGSKKRAPEIFIRLNCEWLYRLIKEPSRINRFYNNNIRYFNEIKKEKRKEFLEN